MAELEAAGHGLGPVGGTKLRENRGYLSPDGSFGDAEQGHDFVVAEALANQAEDLDIPLRQRVSCRPLRARADRGGDRFAAVHGADGLGQILMTDCLHEVAGCTGLHRQLHVLACLR